MMKKSEALDGKTVWGLGSFVLAMVCVAAVVLACFGRAGQEPDAIARVEQAEQSGVRRGVVPQTRKCFACDGLEADVRAMMTTDRPWLPSMPEGGEGWDTPFSACFHPGSNPSNEQMRDLNNMLRGTLAKYNVQNRWSRTALQGLTGGRGSPIVLTWSIVPDGLQIPGAVTAPSTLFAQFDQAFGGRQQWLSVFQRAFNRWGQLANIQYQFVTAPGVDWDDGAAWGATGNGTTRGDVRICMKFIDGPSNILAFNAFPDNGDMTMDSADMAYYATPALNFFNLFSTLGHEHGHGLGLQHTCPIDGTKLMEPSASEPGQAVYNGPWIDEVRAIHDLYGDFFEPNNTVSTAWNIGDLTGLGVRTFGNWPGTVNSPPPNTTTLGIGGAADDDFFRVEMPRAGELSVTVTPVGATYVEGPQPAQPDGDLCGGGQTQQNNTQQAADLAIIVLGPDRLSALATASAAPRGQAESLNRVLVPAGEVFVRVTKVGTPPSGTQFYRMDMSTTGLQSFVATDGLFPDRVRLTWRAVFGTNLRYTILRSTTSNRANAVAITPAGGVAGNTFDDLNVTAGVQYFYWVRTQQDPTRLALDFGGPEAGSVQFSGQCAADVGVQGGGFGADGRLDSNDFVSFLNLFFLSDPRSDVGVQGGELGSDGQWDSNDFTAFINLFFGCTV